MYRWWTGTAWTGVQETPERALRSNAQRSLFSRSKMVPLLALVLLVGFCVSLIDGPSPTDSTNSPTGDARVAGVSSASQEEQLASIDAGRRLGSDNPAVALYGVRLDSLAAKCSESRALLADQAVKGQELLAEGGVIWSVLDVLTAVDTATAGAVSADCTEMLSLLIVLEVG
jgi:hypothetical protein